MTRQRRANSPAMVSLSRGGRIRGLARVGLSFGGVNEYVTLDDLAPHLVASQAWTISYWMRHPGPTAAGQNLFNLNTNGGGNISNQTFLGATNYIAVFAGSTWVTSGRYLTTDVLDDNWHHVMIAVDHAANRLDMWVDGQHEQGSGGTVWPAIAASARVTLGAEWDSPGPTVGNFFAGDILGLAVWFEQLTLTELAPAIYAAGPELDLRRCGSTPDRWYVLGGAGFSAISADLLRSSDVATLQNITAADLIVTGL